ncbi:MAG: sodium:proton antiporter, partial [Candidatus Zixiibacteriota bacterium]
MLTKEAIMNVLSEIDDPELRKPLTELDMVKFIDIKEGDVTVGITLTISGCPLKEKISNDVIEGVKKLPDVKNVKVEFDTMTDKQRENLRKKLGHAPSDPNQNVTVNKFAKRFIAITSGKGGVGKSTIATNLASAFARKGFKVGILDADVYGFSVPRMIGAKGQPTAIDDKIIPVRLGDNLQVMSMGFFVNEDDPVIWRGPLLHKAINQFLSDVFWDDLDYLLLDLPPGTGDVTLTIAQAVPSAEMLVVTTPQQTAVHIAGRVARLAEKTNLKTIGVIENMAYYDVNGEKDYIFGKDGGKELAKTLQTNFFGEIPLEKSIREGADNGKPVASQGDDKY